MEQLGKLFGSAAKVKIIRLFLLNPEHGFETKDIAERSRVPAPSVRSELATLLAAGLIKKKSFIKEETVKRGKKETTKHKKVQGWFLRPEFKYKEALRNLVVDTEFVDLPSLG
jgi:predicted transcriptional regulator